MRILVTGGSGFIGTSLVGTLIAQGASVLNLDSRRPNEGAHQPYWQACDILERDQVSDEFARFAPEQVVHLAARTDVLGTTLHDYRVNTDGTANVLAAIKRTPSIERSIITSTQFVHQYHGQPAHDEDFAPHTVYGESKAITERLTRAAQLPGAWTIIRPTNIWGPWHPRYPFEFWKVVGRGWYFHPGGDRVVRPYGYVGNVIHQVLCLLGAPASTIDRRIFYVGDRPIDLYEWANGFSLQQTGRPARVAPRWCIKPLAAAGELLARAGLPAPITLTRYRNITTSNTAPMNAIYDVCGEPPYTMEAGIAETVRWLRAHHPELVTAPPH